MGCCVAVFLAKKDVQESSSNTGWRGNLMHAFASELLDEDGSDIHTRFADLSLDAGISDAFL